MSSRVFQGDVFDVLPTIAPGSIDVAVTSPPYWKLRSYLPADHTLKSRELGSEPTIAEYIANQVRVADMVRNALADHGTYWINVGDTYTAGGRAGGFRGKNLQNTAFSETRCDIDGIEANQLALVPQRLMIALQETGWIVRSVVIWHKPACLPQPLSGWSWQKCRVKAGKGGKSAGKQGEHPSRTVASLNANWNGDGAKWLPCPGCKKCSATDGYVLRRGSWRPTSSYEPVIMLAKSANYFADGEPVKTPCRDKTFTVKTTPTKGTGVESTGEKVNEWMEANGGRYHPATANLRDVWTISAEPLKEAHYAAYPTKLVDTILRCSTSAHGYCLKCDKPWVRVLEYEQVTRPRPNDKTDRHEQGGGVNSCGNTVAGTASKTIGWRASCRCGTDETRPGRVLDPFGGSGRTARAAQALGLDSVSVELNPEYAEMARRLIRADAPLFAGSEAA